MTKIKEPIVSKHYKQGGLVYFDVASILVEGLFRALLERRSGVGEATRSKNSFISIDLYVANCKK
jgi:hypothetical protein